MTLERWSNGQHSAGKLKYMDNLERTWKTIEILELWKIPEYCENWTIRDTRQHWKAGIHNAENIKILDNPNAEYMDNTRKLERLTTINNIGMLENTGILEYYDIGTLENSEILGILDNLEQWTTLHWKAIIHHTETLENTGIL
ncbi:hypothetical protein Glove_19g68 [Diversispora epigaea]|uniref:Uncharacterized protein n=1 Tax=Diversispora epigaea TaxID=1348612 RepID=A0A397JUX2_9GLOM|nr:hypothetical protein Glove_19g68 [Diversispora epigaea]